MLTSFHIENFRAFRELKLEGLARVNLIAGGNNTGKTALLEALVVVLEAPSATLVQHLGHLFRASNRGAGDADFWDWLLHRPSAQTDVRLTAMASDGSAFERAFNGRRLVGNRPSSPQPAMLGDKRKLLLQGLKPARETALAAFSVIPGEPPQAALRYSRVILKKGRKRVEDLLRQVESRLVTIESLQQEGGSGPMLYADLAGLAEMIPVTQLGQGFNRLLEIYAELVAEEAKVLLMDEVENGLYWKALPVVWDGLINAARELDVQIFATTHSAECIRAADEAARKGTAYDLALIRLDRLDDQIKATVMGEETLRTAKDHDWELR